MANKKIVDTPELRLKPLDLVATTVHELKTPLTLILGLTNMLESGQFGKLNTQQSRYIGRINGVSERLLMLVEGLLIVNKSQEKKLRLESHPVSIPSIIQAVLDELEPQIEHNHMSIKWVTRKIAKPVLADRESLYQIIYNLIDNAIKYSPPKSTITIRAKHEEGIMDLRISDEGVGINTDEMKLLFQRFGRLANPLNSQAGSTGLGLYIVKTLVESQGGEVQVKRLKRGTCFVVRLPLAQQLDLFAKTAEAHQEVSESDRLGTVAPATASFGNKAKKR